MNKDINTQLDGLGVILHLGGLASTAMERQQSMERVDNAVKIVCAALDQVEGPYTPPLTREEYRDVLDNIAGRIECRLERMDEEEIADSREGEEV
jgi:hypothetical protein